MSTKLPRWYVISHIHKFQFISVLVTSLEKDNLFSSSQYVENGPYCLKVGFTQRVELW